MLLPSPRNSLEGQLNLFKSTDCKALLTSEGYNVSQQLIIESKLTPLIVPSLAALLAEGQVTHYPFVKSFEEAKDDPFMVLHTSGSTGLPKPILLTHAWTSALDSYNLLEEIDGFGCLWWKFRNRRVFVVLPPFHVSHQLFWFFLLTFLGCWNKWWAVGATLVQFHHSMATNEPTDKYRPCG